METNPQALNEEGRKILAVAREEASRLNHTSIGSEHLLLGLLRERESDAGLLLTIMNVTLPKARSAVEFIFGRGGPTSGSDLVLAPPAQKVIALAVDEAHAMNHSTVGAEHLLLGVVIEKGFGAGVLEALGVDADLDKMRMLVRRMHPTKRDGQTDST